MIISNSNAAKAKQKMSSYSHRGTRASGGGVTKSYFTEIIRFNVGDAVPTYAYFSNNIEDFIDFVEPELQQIPPGTETVLATATGSGASDGMTLDFVANWDAEHEDPDDPESPWTNYTCDIRIILRRDGATVTMMISPFSNVGKIRLLNFIGSFNYINELFDILFTKQPIYYGVDSLKFEVAKNIECILEADKQYGSGSGGVLHFSNSFYSIFIQDKATRQAFIDEVFASGDQAPFDDEEVDLIRFDIENYQPCYLRMHITSYKDGFFYIYVYDSLCESSENIGGCIEELGYVVGSRVITFSETFTASIVNNCFWNMNAGTITVFQDSTPFDTDVWYTPTITGITGSIEDRMVNMAGLLESTATNVIVSDLTLKCMFFLLVDSTQLDPQYGIPQGRVIFKQTYMHSPSTGVYDRTFSAYDTVNQVEAVFKVTFTIGEATITEVTMGGTTIPTSILDALKWRVMILTSKQGELMVPSEL